MVTRNDILVTTGGDTMTPSRHTVELTGASVSYVEWNAPQPSGPTVLLLHGGGVDSAELSWGEVGPALANAGHRVLAPDHPGFGLSPTAGWPLTQQHLERYIEEFIDAVALDDYAIGGLSLGGGLTLGHLLRQPGRPRGALLLGAFGIMPRLSDGPFSAVTHFGTALLLRTGILAAMTRSYARNAAAMERGLQQIVRNPAARTPELVHDVVTAAAEGEALTVFGEWQREQVGWRRLRTNYTEQLHTIQTPILLVHGELDSGVPLARAQTAAQLLPHAELVTVPDAGHWVQRDRPETVIPTMLRFLQELS